MDNLAQTFRSGWVYVLSHKFYAGHVKIGFTERSVEERIAELESDTGVPRGLAIEYAVFTSDPRKLEHAAHGRLASKRTWPDKEFFEVSPQSASELLRSLANAGGHKVYEEVDPRATRAAELLAKEEEKRRTQEQARKVEQEQQRIASAERARRSGLSPERRFEEDATEVCSRINDQLEQLPKPRKFELGWTWLGAIVGSIGIVWLDPLSPWWGGSLLGAGAGYLYDKSQYEEKVLSPYERKRQSIAAQGNEEMERLAKLHGVFLFERKTLLGKPYSSLEIPSKWRFKSEQN